MLPPALEWGRSVEAVSTPDADMAIRLFGKVTREVYTVWYGRVGTTSYIPSEKVLQLFNDMQLYPSKSQVYEMLQCAKECASRNSAAYLTFGEFCIFATELKRCYERGIPRPAQLSRLLERDGEDKKRRNRKMSKSMPKYEVFLGGSCNPTTWRQDLAIPSLKSLGITYYNPQVSKWVPELIELEYQAKETASVLFFVIDNQTRCIAGTVEVAHIAGRRRKLILVIHPYLGPGQEICEEPISKDEYDDLATGQMVLQDLVERQGIPVFDSVPIALNCTAKVLRENLSVQELGLHDFAQPVKMGHVQLGDKLLKLREAFDALDTTNSGELCLADVCMAFRILTNRNLSLTDLRSIVNGQSATCDSDEDLSPDNCRVNFEQFCAIVAEFQCCESEAWKLWDLVVGKTTRLIGAIGEFVTPLAIALGSEPSTSAAPPPNKPRSAEKQPQEWAFNPRPLRSLPVGSPANNGQSNCVRDVYLGGSCADTTWREDIAIPILKKGGLTYFNPQHCQWSKRLIPIEAAAMDNSYVLLFVIPSSARSLAAMAMAAHYIGLGCNVVLCIQTLPDGCVLAGDKEKTTSSLFKRVEQTAHSINFEGMKSLPAVSHYVTRTIREAIEIERRPHNMNKRDDSIRLPHAWRLVTDMILLSPTAVKDNNRGRMYLSDLANREGVAVFDDVTEAVECVVRKCGGR